MVESECYSVFFSLLRVESYYSDIECFDRLIQCDWMKVEIIQLVEIISGNN